MFFNIISLTLTKKPNKKWSVTFYFVLHIFPLQFLFTIFLFSESILHARIFETWEEFLGTESTCSNYLHADVFQAWKFVSEIENTSA